MALGNLAQRFLVAIVAVPLLLLLLYYHRPEPTWVVIFAASILAMREFFGMTLPAADRNPALVMGALASTAFYWLDPHTLAYAELVFIDVLWPEFRREHLYKCLEEYAARERRFGMTSAQLADASDV